MERIGEYLVRRLVGEGGMGRVYEAEERLSQRRVALKVLRPELARSEDGRRLFLNEMQILARLDHPNVVRCLSCAEIDGELVMALEYLEGHTLREVLNERGPLPWGEAVGLVASIAAALAVAHRQEPAVVHRDLKPENVMVLTDGTVKVMDFGIAKVLQALSRTTTQSVGTLQYMSPEQIDAAPIDGRSDLYSLGLVLYELLAGRPPFESASPRELLNLQCTAEPPPLPEEVRRTVPRGLERLLLELLQKRPDDRPATAEDVLHELEPFVPADDAASTAPYSAPVPSRQGGAPGTASARAPAATPAGRAAAPKARPERAPRGRPERERTPVERADTVALVERATAPREVSGRTGLLVVLGLSLAAGVITYWVRGQVTPVGDRPEPAVTLHSPATPP